MGTLSNPRDLAAIKARIEKLSPDLQRQWGKMTVQQALPHVTDQFRMAMGEISTADRSNFMSRTLVKWLVLAGLPAPKGKVETLPELNQQISGTPPTDFASDLATLKSKLDEFTSKGDDFPWSRHGGFGKLKRGQWMKMAYSHLDHHLRQFGV